ncbi:MAG: nucleoside hydrolase, partial [Corynebacterium variabile]|nr:nucleoside hydrolase [Corynebacterium variabile]
FYMEFHESVGVGYVAQIPDLAAATVLCGAVDAELQDATVRVEAESDLLRGTTVADWPGGTAQGEGRTGENGEVGEVGPYWARPANARILTALDTAEVFACLRDALGAPADR